MEIPMAGYRNIRREAASLSVEPNWACFRPVWKFQPGKEATGIANSRKVSRGVAISPDSRYAFISAEGIGGEPGSADIIDLLKLETVEVIEVGKQGGGTTYWKTTD